MQYVKISIFIISVLLLSDLAISQSIDHNKKITICEGYISPGKALSIIEQNEDIRFSYNPRNFNIKDEIYLCKRNTELKDIISFIFGQEVELVTENRHIIIKPASKSSTEPKQSQPKIKTIKISGTVTNGMNNFPIDSALVRVDEHYIMTNDTGYFNVKITTYSDSVILFIEKEEFVPYKTIITNENNQLYISLRPNEIINYGHMPLSIKSTNSTIENHKFVNSIVNKNQTNIAKSRNVLINKDKQISLIPHIGTYNDQSGLYRFKRSYNILAGYVGEIYGYELGLGINIVRYDMSGFQFAGLANIVGGQVIGTQMSIITNYCTENLRGMQIAGAANITRKNFKGVQLSAGVNIVENKSRGLQLSPVNIVVDSLLGFQTGLINLVQHSAGYQISALANYNEINKKLQFSTLFNISRENNGQQIGIINISKRQNKLQLGIINFADTVKGISIGVFSFVRNGYLHMDYSFSNNMYCDIKFKTGTHKFYNIISTAHKIDKEFNLSLGYGFGSYFRIWKKLGINADFTVSNVFGNDASKKNYNILPQLSLNVNYSFAPRFTVFCGARVNTLFTNQKNEDNLTYGSIIPGNYTFFEKQYSTHRTYIWPEFCIGIRI